jgi:hypothetical protein
MQLSPDAASSPDQEAVGLAHVAFKIGRSTEELQEAWSVLHASGTHILYEADRGFAKSVHVLDPDGNEVELYVETLGHCEDQLRCPGHFARVRKARSGGDRQPPSFGYRSSSQQAGRPRRRTSVPGHLSSSPARARVRGSSAPISTQHPALTRRRLSSCRLVGPDPQGASAAPLLVPSARCLGRRAGALGRSRRGRCAERPAR